VYILRTFRSANFEWLVSSYDLINFVNSHRSVMCSKVIGYYDGHYE